MTSQPGKQTIIMHILPNTSKSRGNQTMKFGQLIEYNMKNIFLEKSYIKYDEKTSPRPFPKKIKIKLDTQLKDLYNLFLLYVQVEDYQNKLKL